MAEKCPFCGRDLHTVTRGGRGMPPATYVCSNPDCPLSRISGASTMQDLANEWNRLRQVERARRWRTAEQTRILCPHCMLGFLERLGNRFRCPQCNERFDSEEEVRTREEEIRERMGERRYKAARGPARGTRRQLWEMELNRIRRTRRGRYGSLWWMRGRYWDESRRAKRRYLAPKHPSFREGLSTNITAANVVFAFVFIGAGFILAAVAGNMWFMFAFLSVGTWVIFPAPYEYKGPGMSWSALNPFSGVFRPSHTGFAFLKSISKISAIMCFAMAFRDFGGVMNIPFILICFAGYFSLKIRYDSEVPGEFLESLLRFGILGAFFIPFMIFRSIFESWVLVVIAFAFFAIPPMPKGNKENVAILAYWDTFDKLIFVILMGVALIGSGSMAAIPGLSFAMFGAGWALKGAMAYTFLYFWGISLMGGLFSPPETRPITGFVMIMGATVIWGLGPGSQEVGSALLGQWWPSVHNAFVEISKPISDVFGALGETFGNAFLMITNPVAYAHQIMEGNYGKTGGTEKVGSFGVEISEFRIGTGMNDIYVEQPYQIMFGLKNEGGFEAKNVRASLFTELTYQNMSVREILSPREKVYIEELVGKQERVECTKKNGKCSEYTFYVDGKKDNKLEQQDMRSFIMGGVLGCDVVNRADLREKFIPVNVKVEYEYEVESEFKMEFLSQNEWSRMAKAGTLVKRSEVSTMTTAPVKLSIAGMEQPIRAGTGFFIGLELKSMEGENSLITPPVRVEVDIPREFITQEGKVPCYGQAEVKDGKIIWEIKEGEGFKENILYCDFYPAESVIVPGGSPSKTYFIKAKATYGFSKWDRKDAKLAFGSWCCSNKDCEKAGKVCNIRAGETRGTCQEPGAVPKPKECSELNSEECKKRTDCQWNPGANRCFET